MLFGPGYLQNKKGAVASQVTGDHGLPHLHQQIKPYKPKLMSLQPGDSLPSA